MSNVEAAGEGLDLETVDVRPLSQQGVPMVLMDPAGKPTKVTLLVRGTDCAAYDEKMKEHIRRGVDRARKATELERNHEFWDLHATLVAGWSGIKKGGQPLAYSHEAAAKLLEEYQWIFEQVRQFADRRANFLPAPSNG